MQAISTPITDEDYLALPFTRQKTEYIEQWEAIALDMSAVFPVGNPPALVVEILSPGNWRNDMSEKEAGYATARVSRNMMSSIGGNKALGAIL